MGASSDIVRKEMYTLERGGESFSLRPEGTAPICRAYVEHGLHREPQPQKLFTIASMYRYGAPGRGRHREHWQASVEAIGSDDPAIGRYWLYCEGAGDLLFTENETNQQRLWGQPNDIDMMSPP